MDHVYTHGYRAKHSLLLLKEKYSNMTAISPHLSPPARNKKRTPCPVLSGQRRVLHERQRTEGGVIQGPRNDENEKRPPPRFDRGRPIMGRQLGCTALGGY